MNSKHIAILSAILSLPVCAMAQSEVDSVQVASASQKVHVAYQTVDGDELLGGVSVLDMKELLEKNYLNGIQGQNWEGYVPGWNGNSLWGQDGGNDNGYLTLIDGVPRDANNISPTEIDQITFLKGAQAVVLYGSRAAKGAILITTKRGQEGPLTISVRANTGWHVAKSFPEYLGAAEYMTMYNQARVNDGLVPSYSDDDIYNTASGANPYRYPDVNFYSKKYIKKAYNFSDATAEISGGSQLAQFYTNINYLRYDDMVNFGEGKDAYTDRFSVRGNVNLRLGSWVKAHVDANATFYSSKNGKGNYWDEATKWRPNRVNPLIPVSLINESAADALALLGTTNNIYDGCFLAGTSIDNTNIFADYYAAGYSRFTSRQFQFNAGVDIDLAQVTKGLSFSTMFAVDYATSYNTTYTNKYAVFTPSWLNLGGKDEILGLTQEGKDERTGNQSIENGSDRQTLNWTAQFNYTRTFADVHHVNAIALVNGWQRTFSGQYHKTSNANVGLQANYNYDRRYYVDFALAGMHTAKLAPGNRDHWSPSLSLGWHISEENFLKDVDAVDELMLSVSASDIKTDLDIDGWYLYNANYASGGWFNWAPGGYEAFYPSRGENPDLQPIHRKEISANIRGSFFNRALSIDASVFKTKTTGLLIDNATIYPSYFSTYYPDASFIPWTNYNDNERTGFDFGVKVNKTFGEVNLQLGVNGTYYDTKALKRDEIYADAYQYREGKILDGIWGYECLGFFESADEVATWADQSALGGTNLQGGDLKYKDQNGDGVINNQDQVLLAKGGWYGAPFTMGANFTAQYKGFTLFVLCTGYFGGHGVKNNENYWWISGNDKYSSVVRGAWTPETAATATYPRLTTTDGSNNFVTSDFWVYDTDRFDLAKVQLTYTFQPKLFEGKVVKGLSIYASGSNLLTCGKNKDILELNIGSQAQTRYYNIGAKVTF